MKPLTSSQRKRLRGLAHDLKPLVHLGKAGLTDAALAQIDKELADHELIKVRFLESGSAGGKAEKDARIDEIQNRLGCGAAGRVGHIAILYRPHADPDRAQDRPREIGRGKLACHAGSISLAARESSRRRKLFVDRNREVVTP